MVKNPPANARDTGSNSWVRNIPLRRKWLPTSVFLPRKSHGQRSLGAIVQGVSRVGPDLVTKPATTTSTKPEVVKNVLTPGAREEIFTEKIWNQARKLFD